MLCFVASRAHARTHKSITRYPDIPAVQLWNYDRLFRARRVPRATWIFTDMDRLGFWELELATHIFYQLAQAGVKVLNNPALVYDRYLLLKQLHAAGINRFTAWLAAAPEHRARFPVFLRTNHAHRGILTDLIHTPEALANEIQHAVDSGFPLRDLLVVECFAEPLKPGLYAKYASFRCGEHIVETVGVHSQHWIAKDGQLGVAGADVYEEEYARIRYNPHAETLMKAFQIGRIEYGRADYALIDGTPQVYEINTNPLIGTIKSHPYPIRIQSHRLFEQKYAAALRALDTTTSGPPIRLNSQTLKTQRLKDLLHFPSRWIP